MPSSELTDALNPLIGQQRESHYPSDYPSQLFRAFPPQSSFTPHRSELEYAISEPPPPPRPKVDAAHVVQELLRAIAATREAQESENKRRAAWEQEFEAKYQQRQAETESQLAEMKRQIAYLEACVASLLQRRRESTSHVSSGSGYLLDEPGSPTLTLHPGASVELPPPFVPHGHVISERSQRHGMLGDSGSEATVSSTGKRPQKRTNNHDKSPPMRKHIYHLLGVSPEDELPPSHCEGLPLNDNEPVRFVWEKTIKQLYQHVPEADFAFNTVSTAFDQSFSTFRQKYRIQIDPTVLLTVKTREEQKAMKSRRLHRKKLKREQRNSMRERSPAFAHATFDGAMVLDCMSSEESDDGSKQSTTKEKVLVVRGIPWRSNRLLKLYSILDEDDRLDKDLKPKRGVGRRERNEGPPKDNLTFPPKGVASWMVSRRWFRDVQITHPEVLRAAQELIYDPPGFDWTKFDALGYETDDEHVSIGPNAVQHGAQFTTLSSAFTTSYALVDALAPAS
ncbi:hypothetical protein F5148DRAFT_1165091 [Russula earlei]|uniref:Uncharacterized protein n=1 Tax=Russula earlei TaxID=71964 RepID=A0ACC0ULS2_9AGAM|nr:hypothetical protein F5148DRAFT_1165091 [Russula earlei]